AGATSRRRPTNLDERTLVPAMLPVVPLNGQSTIPTNLPLESIAARVVVPRDVNRAAYAGGETPSALPPQPTELDERITLTGGAAHRDRSSVGAGAGHRQSRHLPDRRRQLCSGASQGRGIDRRQVADVHALRLGRISYRLPDSASLMEHAVPGPSTHERRG